MTMLDFLLPPCRSDSFFVGKAIGYLFIILAILGGMYFLFQELIPLIGYVESGIVVCGILGCVGGLLLFLGQTKKDLPREDLLQKAISFFRDLDIEKHLKDNAIMVSLLSFGIGIVLSQLKDPRKLSDFYKLLK